jgi:glutaredoxin
MLKTTILFLTCLFWLPIAMSGDFDDSGGSLKLVPTTTTKNAPSARASTVKATQETGFTDNGSLQYIPPQKPKGAQQGVAVDPATTVMLYGVTGCPYAKKAKDMLTAKGIPFVYVDLNSSNFRTNHEQRVMQEFQNQGSSSFSNPVLEYRGVAYDNPDLYSVIEQLK